MKTLFERLKPQNKSKVLDFVFKYPATGESLLKDLNNIYIVNLKYGMAIELNRICNHDSTVSFGSISNLFEE